MQRKPEGYAVIATQAELVALAVAGWQELLPAAEPKPEKTSVPGQHQ